MSEKPQWEELEDFDTQLIVSDDDTIEVYYHDKSTKYDYTKNGWTRLATENHLSVVGLDVEELEDKYRAVATARRHIRVEGISEVIHVDRKGGHEQKKIEFNKEDSFAFTKAISKAIRNAYKEHMRGHPDINQENLAVLYLKQQGTSPKGAAPPAQSQSSSPSQDQSKDKSKMSLEEWTSTKRREMFAVFGEHKDTLATMGIDEKVLAEGMYKRFGVRSRADMTADQYLSVAKAIRYVAPTGEMYAEWIRDLGTEPDVGESEATAKIADQENLVDEDDIPFGHDEPKLAPPPSFRDELEAKTQAELKIQTNTLVNQRKEDLEKIGVSREDLIVGTYMRYEVNPDAGDELSKEQYIEVIEALSHTKFPSWVENFRPPQKENGTGF